MYIHPGSHQRLPEQPNKNILDQWKKLPIDWVRVGLFLAGLVCVWLAFANNCNNGKSDRLDPICEVVPH